MRACAIRTFPARYHVRAPREIPLSGREVPTGVESARIALIVLGVAFALAGLFIASAVDPLIGMGALIVGAFLLVLPFTRDRDEE